MDLKSKALLRLEKMKPQTGLLPTSVKPAESLREISEHLERRELDAAARASTSHLRGMGLEAAQASPITELFGGRELREQVSGFARAGVAFFHADNDLWRMRPEERAARGGNSAVTRVFINDQRLLLETSRLVLRFEAALHDEERIELMRRHGVTPLGDAGLPPDVTHAFVGQDYARDTCIALMSEPGVVYAEPDFIEHIGSRCAGPGGGDGGAQANPDLSAQWHHAAVSSQTAWEFSGGEGVHIAVIDNGFDTAHPDLSFGRASAWYRPTPTFDDADFIAGTDNMPDQNHGTACAGMIGSILGEGREGAGVAPGAELSMIAAAVDQLSTQTTLARAIAYAAKPELENPDSPPPAADVIACSLGPNGANWSLSAVLSDAIDFAATQGRNGKGCAIYWACTNGNFPISSDEVCSHPQVAAIGRSTRDDTDDGSGFGPELEFLAPGVDVYIPSSGGGYSEKTGTSYAGPCAAAIAGLALARNPALSAEDLRALMRESCEKVGDLPYIEERNDRFGHGRINAESAVTEAGRLAAGG